MFSITAVQSGEAALKVCNQARFDFILMDVSMPGMSGPEAAVLIQQLPFYSNVPIIPLTANVLEADKITCKEAGMYGFLAKPLRRQELIGMLNEVSRSHVHCQPNNNLNKQMIQQ